MNLPDDSWNRFVLRAIEEAPQIEAEKPLYALFWYQTEVNNGGHLQYFLNVTEPGEWHIAVDAARSIGQDEVAANLAQSVALWESVDRTAPNSTEQFVDAALEDEFGHFDRKFYELEGPFRQAFENAIE